MSYGRHVTTPKMFLPEFLLRHGLDPAMQEHLEVEDDSYRIQAAPYLSSLGPEATYKALEEINRVIMEEPRPRFSEFNLAGLLIARMWSLLESVGVDPATHVDPAIMKAKYEEDPDLDLIGLLAQLHMDRMNVVHEDSVATVLGGGVL